MNFEDLKCIFDVCERTSMTKWYTSAGWINRKQQTLCEQNENDNRPSYKKDAGIIIKKKSPYRCKATRK